MKVCLLDVFRHMTSLKERLDETDDEADRYRIASQLRRISTTYIHLDEELMSEHAQDAVH